MAAWLLDRLLPSLLASLTTSVIVWRLHVVTNRRQDQTHAALPRDQRAAR